MKADILSKRAVKRQTWIGVLLLLVFLVFSLLLWKRLVKSPKTEGKLQPILRNTLMTNENLYGDIFSPRKLSKEYPKWARARNARVNGMAGMSFNFDPEKWMLHVARLGGKDTLKLTLADIKKLPKTEVIFDFKCIEGWNQVSHWGGVRFSDFVKHYGLEAEVALANTGLITPDYEYYVGIDNESMMQPQTLLCYELNEQPLPLNQGYPLRLIIPVKYGVKHLKRIGLMWFSDDKPRDYWAERGYDWYVGL